MKTTFVVFFAIICTSLSIKAQRVEYVAEGLRVGGGISNLRGINKYTDHIPGTFIQDRGFTTGILPALELGPVFQVMYTNNVMLQAEGLMSTSGARFKHSRYVTSVYDIYFTLHMKLGGKIRVNDDFRFVLGAGPFFGYDLSFLIDYDRDYSRSSFEDYPKKTNINFAEADYKHFDAGISAMAGFEYFNWQLTLSYDHGLTNLVHDIHKMQSRKYKLGIVYFVAIY